MFRLDAQRSPLLLAWIGALLVIAGCQSPLKNSEWSWPWEDSSKHPNYLPDRMLPIWTDTVLHQPNQPGLRGFGGRIFFYRDGDTDPIEVDGGLAVYVFDAEQLNPQKPMPEKKFVFTAEQFSHHMSQSSMGPSYSIWLPWDEVGGPNQRLSIVARFEGAQGGTIISEPTMKLLPGVGKVRSSTGRESNPSNHVQAASFQQSSEFELRTGQSTDAKSQTSEPPKASRKARKEVETIELPPSFQRHWQSRSGGDDVEPSITTSSVQAVPPSNHSMAEARSPSQVEAPATPLETTVLDYRTRSYPARTQGTSPADPIATQVSDGGADGSITSTREAAWSRWNGQKRMFREAPDRAGWIPSLPRTPR